MTVHKFNSSLSNRNGMIGMRTRVSSDLQVPHETNGGGRRGAASGDVSLPTVDDTFGEEFTDTLQRKYFITS